MEQEAVLFRGVFADKRVDKRCEQVYPSIVDGGSAVLHRCISNRAAMLGAYQFMNDHHVHYEQVQQRLTSNWPCRDRLLYQGTDQTRKISQQLELCQAETFSLPVRKSGQRQQRVAELEVKYTRLQVASPRNGVGPKSSVAVFVMEAICWRLVTSIGVETLAQAVQCLYYYSLRWRIEELFALVKSQGMQPEDSRLESGKALKEMAALALQLI